MPASGCHRRQGEPRDGRVPCHHPQTSAGSAGFNGGCARLPHTRFDTLDHADGGGVAACGIDPVSVEQIDIGEGAVTGRAVCPVDAIPTMPAASARHRQPTGLITWHIPQGTAAGRQNWRARTGRGSDPSELVPIGAGPPPLGTGGQAEGGVEAAPPSTSSALCASGAGCGPRPWMSAARNTIRAFIRPQQCVSVRVIARRMEIPLARGQVSTSSTLAPSAARCTDSQPLFAAALVS